MKEKIVEGTYTGYCDFTVNSLSVIMIRVCSNLVPLCLDFDENATVIVVMKQTYGGTIKCAVSEFDYNGEVWLKVDEILKIERGGAT